MPSEFLSPGVYVEEIPGDVRPIQPVATSIAAFIGRTPHGPTYSPWTVNSYSEFENDFGKRGISNSLATAVEDFFANGGRQALIVRVFRENGTLEGLPPDGQCYHTAFDALRKTDLFNLLCLPSDSVAENIDTAVLQSALKLCVERRALLIVDPRSDWNAAKDLLDPEKGLSALGLSGPATRNAAIFFPHLQKAYPDYQGRRGTMLAAPCGAVAGVMARSDAQRGVWKAAAGQEANVMNIQGLSVSLTDRDNAQLGSLGVNCLRSFPGTGPVVWGTRTLHGNDQASDVYKYIPVRRLALFIEESLSRGTRWLVFEPNNEQAWAKVRLNVGAFMNNLFREGAFAGSKADEAYFIKCDAETTTQNDRNLGVVNILVGFAPLKPAEFVIINLQQVADQIQA